MKGVIMKGEKRSEVSKRYFVCSLRLAAAQASAKVCSAALKSIAGCPGRDRLRNFNFSFKQRRRNKKRYIFRGQKIDLTSSPFSNMSSKNMFFLLTHFLIMQVSAEVEYVIALAITSSEKVTYKIQTQTRLDNNQETRTTTLEERSLLKSFELNRTLTGIINNVT